MHGTRCSNPSAVRFPIRLFWLALAGWLAFGGLGLAAVPGEGDTAPAVPNLWQAGVGEGFQRGTQEISLSAGAGVGMPVFGTEWHHHWAFGTVRYGRIVTGVVARDHWFRGNLELAAEFFGGAQFEPDSAYVVGFAPQVRYLFATGTRWVPFFDIGAGVAATDIRNGDLSTTFEFDLQWGFGLNWFLTDTTALTAEYRFVHLSNAGIDYPNQGVNNSTFLIGVSWFF